MNLTNTKEKGFTLMEVVVVIAVLGAIAAITLASFYIIQKRSELNNNANELANILKLAQNLSITSEQESQYGVYFDTSSAPNRYILFKGANFSARESSFDQIYYLSKNTELFNVSLGGASEVVFKRISGSAEPSGNVSLRLISDPSLQKTVYISAVGIVSFNSSSSTDDGRIKDSRHVHFDYSRNINVNSENIILLFNGNQTLTIPIITNMSEGQIFWEGTINVAGSDQQVKIKTHRLNNPNTQFSFYRDRRFNNKSLKISLSADSSGSIAEYSADGLTTVFGSVYVSNFKWE